MSFDRSLMKLRTLLKGGLPVLLTVVMAGMQHEAMGELVVMQSGKTLEGDVVYQDEETVHINTLEGTYLEINRSMVRQVFSDQDAADWKSEQEKQNALPTPDKSGGMMVIKKETSVVRRKSLKEIGKIDQEFSLDQYVMAPSIEGNAARYYYKIVSRDKFKKNEINYEEIYEAAQLKDCNFYEEYLGYPVELIPDRIKFGHLRTVADSLIKQGNMLIADGYEGQGVRNLEVALILGYHLGLHAPVLNQFSVSNAIQILAGSALADHYLNKENSTEKDSSKYHLFTEFVNDKKRDQIQIRLTLENFRQEFLKGKLSELMTYARDGENDLIRAFVMKVLVVVKLTGEQQPLPGKIKKKIPLKFHSVFQSIRRGDSEDIAELFDTIKERDSNQFLQKEADYLLTLSGPVHLLKGVQAPRVLK